MRYGSKIDGKQKYKKSIFIFRRDLRLDDNTALINALNYSDLVYCIFILDSNIITPLKSSYSSFSLPIDPHILLKRKQKRINLLKFLKESLFDLRSRCNQTTTKNIESNEITNKTKISSKLTCLFGDPSAIIDRMIKLDSEIEAIFVNRDYTPFSIKRDQLISEICKKYDVDFIDCLDILLNEPEDILNSNNKPFKVFSHYYNKAIEKPLLKKENSLDIEKFKNNFSSYDNNKLIDNFKDIKIVDDLENFFSKITLSKNQIFQSNSSLLDFQFNGTRKKYQDIISKLIKFKKNDNYNIKNNLLENPSTHLSPYLKFGLCSIREVYFAIQKELGGNHPLLRQLYWRDFFVYIGFHFPFVFKDSFQGKYKNNVIKWKNEPKKFKVWCQGKTGFPIVDAGMRELNETGFMHNRTRLITASFLVKDLHIDWRYGERYFALKLVDYDPSVNNGNWQWVASTGCDAQPYFRIFNPWLQQKKFDPYCKYIKKWIPELEKIPKELIHKWYESKSSFNNPNKSDSIRYYPRPIVDHQKEILITKELYNIGLY
ncbi:MAG: cryptochrome/photolyase family protein [Nitrososphaeraceae archaeon]